MDPRISIVTLEVADLERSVGAGATLVQPARDVFWGGYSGYLADPDGHLWEVPGNPHAPLDGTDEP